MSNEDGEDIFADTGETRLDLTSLDNRDLGAVVLGFLLLLMGGDGTPRRSASNCNVFECDREEIAFLDGEIPVE